MDSGGIHSAKSQIVFIINPFLFFKGKRMKREKVEIRSARCDFYVFMVLYTCFCCAWGKYYFYYYTTSWMCL